MRPLRIGLLGTRGIPARYGGFETFAEELSTRLVARGHQVSVYSRHRLGSPPKSRTGSYRGVTTVSTPTILHKYLETPLAGLTSFLHAAFARYDVILLCNAANAPCAWIGRLSAMPVAINVDGIERNRSKWNTLGRLWYRLGEICSVIFASRVIADAKVIEDYYQETYRCQSTVITYGASIHPTPPGETLKRLGVLPREYLLYVSRLEPENNALGVIRAYVQSGVKIPLVVVGSAPYAQEYIAQCRAAANDRVVFAGYQFEGAYHELQSNAAIYIQATEVGGTHPALVEAMGYGNCVIANGTPENREVLGDAGVFYDKNNFDQLAGHITHLLGNPTQVAEWREKARARAQTDYNWDSITESYESLFYELLGPA